MVLADWDQLDLVAFGQFRAPVFVRAMLRALENLIGKVRHFLGFAGQFGDLADQFVLFDIALVAFIEQTGVQSPWTVRAIRVLGFDGLSLFLPWLCLAFGGGFGLRVLRFGFGHVCLRSVGTHNAAGTLKQQEND